MIETGLFNTNKMSLMSVKVFYNKQNSKSINIENMKKFPVKLSCIKLKVLYRGFYRFIVEHLKQL